MEVPLIGNKLILRTEEIGGIKRPSFVILNAYHLVKNS
jgi:hypothetical protein